MELALSLGVVIAWDCPFRHVAKVSRQHSCASVLRTFVCHVASNSLCFRFLCLASFSQTRPKIIFKNYASKINFKVNVWHRQTTFSYRRHSVWKMFKWLTLFSLIDWLIDWLIDLCWIYWWFDWFWNWLMLQLDWYKLTDAVEVTNGMEQSHKWSPLKPSYVAYSVRTIIGLFTIGVTRGGAFASVGQIQVYCPKSMPWP